MEKREQRRVRRRLAVRFGESELTSRGITRDISAGGAFVVCGQPPPVGTRLRMEIQLGGDRQVRAIGVVRRVRLVPLELRQIEAMGFGVAFVGARPIELAEAPVSEGPKAFELHYPTGKVLREAWQSHLRIGGAVITTDRPVEFGERVCIRVCLDFAGRSLVLPARVVRVDEGPPRTVAVSFEEPQALRTALASFVAS